MTDRQRGGYLPAPTSPTQSARQAAARIAVLPFIVAVLVLTACAPPPPVGRQPSPQVPISTPTATPTPTEWAAAAYKIDIFIDARTVTPLRRAVALERGRTVVLVFRSDHDVTATISGAGIQESVFVARLSTITESFVVDQLGVVTISTTDPAAIIAELTVIPPTPAPGETS